MEATQEPQPIFELSEEVRLNRLEQALGGWLAYTLRNKHHHFAAGTEVDVRREAGKIVVRLREPDPGVTSVIRLKEHWYIPGLDPWWTRIYSQDL